MSDESKKLYVITNSQGVPLRYSMTPESAQNWVDSKQHSSKYTIHWPIRVVGDIDE